MENLSRTEIKTFKKLGGTVERKPVQKKRFTIEYDQCTPMGLSSSHTYTEKITTTNARMALKMFESRHKEDMGCDMYGNYRSAYQITGWDIVEVDGIRVSHTFNEKKNRVEYVDSDGRRLA